MVTSSRRGWPRRTPALRADITSANVTERDSPETHIGSVGTDPEAGPAKLDPTRIPPRRPDAAEGARFAAMTGYPLGVVKLEPTAAVGSLEPGRPGGLAARQRRLHARDWCGWPG